MKKYNFRKIIALFLVLSLVGQIVFTQVGTYMSAEEVSGIPEALEAEPLDQDAQAEKEAKAKAEAEAKAKAEAEAKAAEEAKAKAEAQAKAAEEAEAKAEAEAKTDAEAKADNESSKDTQNPENTKAPSEDGKDQPLQSEVLTPETLDLAEPAGEETSAKDPADYVKQLIFENDEIKVTLAVDKEDVLPKDAALTATRITRQEITEEMEKTLARDELSAIRDMNALYDELCRSLAAKGAAAYYTIQGFMIYDFAITDADGKPLPVKDELTVTVEHKEPAYIKDVDTTDMDVRIFKPLARENEDQAVRAALDLARKEDGSDHNHTKALDLTKENKIEKASFVCDELYPVAIAWTLGLPDDIFTRQVDDVEVTVTAKAGVIPEGAALSVEKIVQPAELAQIQEALNEDDAIEAPVKDMIALDIRFMKDDQEVQPDGEVKVSFKNIAIEAPAEEMAVAHVDDEMKVTDMEASAEGQDGLEFETTHFSVYVIYNTSENDITVKTNHYTTDNGTQKMIYLSNTETVDANGTLYPINKAENWEVAGITVKQGGTSTPYTPADAVDSTSPNAATAPFVKQVDTTGTGETFYMVRIGSDAEIDINYTPKVDPNWKGATTIYDYTVLLNTDDAGTWVDFPDKAQNKLQLWVDSEQSNAAYRTDRAQGAGVYKGWAGDSYWGDRINPDAEGWIYASTNGNQDSPGGVQTGLPHGTQIRIKNDGTIQVKSGTVGHYSIDMPDTSDPNPTKTANGYDTTAALDSHWEKGVDNQSRSNNITMGKVGEQDQQLWTYAKEYSYTNGAVGSGSPQYPNAAAWNVWTGSEATYQGLLKDLDANGNPRFKYNTPGFFNNSDLVVNVGGENKYLRKVYNNYKLDFTQTGDSYHLDGVSLNGTRTTNSGYTFYPIDYVETGIEQGAAGTINDPSLKDKYGSYDMVNQSANASGIGSDGLHNFFFGMRYDIDFTIGDYCGDMTYWFSGDDDFWAVLSVVDDQGNIDISKEVIAIDMGGIHSTCAGQVDLWTDVLSNSKYSSIFGGGINRYEAYKGDPSKEYDPEDENNPRNWKYRLTILYMERGANYSNCNMEFTIPNANINKGTTPSTSLTVKKTDATAQTQPLADATFEMKGLTGSAIGYHEEFTTALSSGGQITFSGLKPGSYHLIEKQAPNGYIKQTGEWIVKVRVTENNITKAEVWSIKAPNTHQELINSEFWTGNVLTVENVPEQKVVKVFKGLAEDEMALVKTNPAYKITVTKGSGADLKTWELLLDDPTYNCVKTVPTGTTDEFIYTWTLKGEEAKGTYTVKEDNEELSPYVVTRTLESNDNNKVTGWDGGRPTATTLLIQDGDVITLTNTYANPTKTRIKVAKTFIGLPQTEIDKLTSFQMDLYRVKKAGETVDVHIKTLTLDATSYTEKGPDGSGNIVYTWDIPNIDTGEYYVIETNYDTLTTYKHILKTGDGASNKMDASQPNWELDYNATVQTTCSTTLWNMTNKLVIAKVGSGSGNNQDTGKTVLVFTEEVLSTAQQKTIEAFVKKNLKEFDKGNGTEFFYYSKGEGLTVKGTTINWTDSDLNFGSTNTWQMFTYDNYSWKNGKIGDLHVTNTYKPSGVVLDIKKYGTAYPVQDNIPEKTGSSFCITRGTWAQNATTQKMEFTKKLKADNSGYEWTEIFDPSAKSPEYGLEDATTPTNNTPKLEAGDYILEEITAPSGYCLLTAPIYLRVENGEARLVDDQGAAITPGTGGVTEEVMWKLEGDTTTGYILRIKNEVLYSLPSTGGTGIYWSTLMGILLMIAAGMLTLRRRA